MILKVDDVEYKVHFRYENRYIYIQHDRTSLQRDTVCLLHLNRLACSEVKPCNIIHSNVGFAAQHYNDNFSRKTGRKIAFARALRPYDRETRGKFWKAYFEVVGY